MKAAIIPSSTKSVRVPGKNTIPVNGEPMMNYPVKAAQASGLFDQIIVSTADEETAAIARKSGCRVFPSPMALQAKSSTVTNVCVSVLERLQNQGEYPDYFCCIFATAIFLQPYDFTESFKLLDNTDFVLGVSEFIYEPEHALIEKNGYLRPANPKSFRHKAPWFPRKYASNGTLAWCRVEPFMSLRDFYGPRLTGYTIPRDRVVDINTPADLDIAKKLMRSTLPAVLSAD